MSGHRTHRTALTLAAAVVMTGLLLTGCATEAEPPAGDDADQPSSDAPVTGPSGVPPRGTGNADVVTVRAAQEPAGTWTFVVTVRHPDTGNDDYADGWDVVTPDGKVLKSDVSIAKNYLNEAHVKELNRIVSAYLDLAENRAERGRLMKMADWAYLARCHADSAVRGHTFRVEAVAR